VDKNYLTSMIKAKYKNMSIKILNVFNLVLKEDLNMTVFELKYHIKWYLVYWIVNNRVL
jgi:hypothetical protein